MDNSPWVARQQHLPAAPPLFIASSDIETTASIIFDEDSGDVLHISERPRRCEAEGGTCGSGRSALFLPWSRAGHSCEYAAAPMRMRPRGKRERSAAQRLGEDANRHENECVDEARAEVDHQPVREAVEDGARGSHVVEMLALRTPKPMEFDTEAVTAPLCEGSECDSFAGAAPTVYTAHHRVCGRPLLRAGLRTPPPPPPPPPLSSVPISLPMTEPRPPRRDIRTPPVGASTTPTCSIREDDQQSSPAAVRPHTEIVDSWRALSSHYRRGGLRTPLLPVTMLQPMSSTRVLSRM